jgi:uncharacterized DUF497 family protein
MNNVWDERKRLANIDKHGLDFADLNETFFDSAVVLPRKTKPNGGLRSASTAEASSLWYSRASVARA